eukprot:Gb_13853 [translate_table: standard]
MPCCLHSLTMFVLAKRFLVIRWLQEYDTPCMLSKGDIGGVRVEDVSMNVMLWAVPGSGLPLIQFHDSGVAIALAEVDKEDAMNVFYHELCLYIGKVSCFDQVCYSMEELRGGLTLSSGRTALATPNQTFTVTPNIRISLKSIKCGAIMLGIQDCSGPPVRILCEDEVSTLVRGICQGNAGESLYLGSSEFESRGGRATMLTIYMTKTLIIAETMTTAADDIVTIARRNHFGRCTGTDRQQYITWNFFTLAPSGAKRVPSGKPSPASHQQLLVQSDLTNPSKLETHSHENKELHLKKPPEAPAAVSEAAVFAVQECSAAVAAVTNHQMFGVFAAFLVGLNLVAAAMMVVVTTVGVKTGAGTESAGSSVTAAVIAEIVVVIMIVKPVVFDADEQPLLAATSAAAGVAVAAAYLEYYFTADADEGQTVKMCVKQTVVTVERQIAELVAEQRMEPVEDQLVELTGGQTVELQQTAAMIEVGSVVGGQNAAGDVTAVVETASVEELRAGDVTAVEASVEEELAVDNVSAAELVSVAGVAAAVVLLASEVSEHLLAKHFETKLVLLSYSLNFGIFL